jgi:hypothetical protein
MIYAGNTAMVSQFVFSLSHSHWPDALEERGQHQERVSAVVTASPCRDPSHLTRLRGLPMPRQVRLFF